MIRQLTLEKFDRKRSYGALVRETKIGLVNGLIIAILVLTATVIITHKPELAMVMSLALLLDMVVGAFAGAGIPLLLKEMGRDPAQASSIFLTSLTDAFGFFALLGLAELFLIGQTF
jgi:magnesium transporter